MALTIADLLVRLRGSTAEFDKSMNAAAARLNAVGKSMQATGRTIAMRLGLPLAGVGVAAAKLTADFDTEMSKIVGLVGLPREQVAAWREDIMALGPATGKSMAELGRGMFFVTSAGLRGETALRTLEAAAKGAAAGLGDTETVADAATSAMNAYGESNLSAEQAVATLVATVREGKAEASSIAPALGKVIPIAAELGVSFDQVGASIAAMTRLGLDAQTSTISLRQVLSSLVKPSKQSEDALKGMGTSSAELRSILREEGLIALLFKLKDMMGGNADAMAQVFGNIRALTGVLNLVGQNADKARGIFKSLANTTEKDLNYAFAAFEETVGFKFNQAMAEANVLMLRLGDTILPTLMPMLEQVVEWVQKAAEWFHGLTETQKELVTWLGLATIALGPLLMALGLIAQGIGSVVTVAGGIGTAFATIGPIVGTFVETLSAMAASSVVVSGALVALAGVVGWLVGDFFRPMINEVLGLNEALDLVANKYQDQATGLAENEEAFRSQLDAYTKLRDQLGLIGEEWDVQAEHTEDNARRLSTLTDKVIKLAQEERNLQDTQAEGMTIHEQALDIDARAKAQVADALANLQQQEEAHLATLKEKYDLMSGEDAVAGLQSLVEEFEALKGKVDEVQLADAMNAPMEDLLELAARNKMELPEGVREMAKALGENASPEIQKLIEGWHTFNTDARATGEILDGIFWSRGEQVESTLHGGFKRGIEQGVQDGGVAMDAFVQRLENTTIYIPVQPNLDSWNKAVDDYINGRVPDTSG